MVIIYLICPEVLNGIILGNLQKLIKYAKKCLRNK